MAVNIGPRIGIDGEAEFRQQINDIVQQQKTLNAEMKKSQAEFKASGDVEKKNTEQKKILTEQIETQRKKIALLQKGVEESTKATGENSSATAKWKQALYEAQTQAAELENSVDDAGGKVQVFSDKTLDSIASLDAIGDALDAASEKIIDLGQTAIEQRDKLDDALDTLQFGLGATNEQMDEYGDILTDIGKSIPVSDMNDLADAIATVGTKSGLSGDDLAKVSTEIAQLAKLSGESASSIADDAISIAKNFDISYSEALDIMMNASQGFGISFDDVAKAAESSGQTLTQTFGLSVEQVVGLMGTMEAQGIDSTQAVTGLTKAAQNMSSDGTASLESLNAVLKGLADGTISASDATDIFGSRAINFINFLQSSGISSVEDLASAYDNAAGSIQNVSDMYAEMADAGDDVTVAHQTMDTAIASIGDTLVESLAPAMQQIADLTSGIQALWEGLSPDMQAMIITIGEIVVATTGIISAIAGVQKAMTAINAIISANPAGLVIAAIALVVSAIVALWQNSEGFRDFVTGAIDTITKAIDKAVKWITQAVTNVTEGITTAWNTATDWLTDKWDKLSSACSTTFGNIKSAVSNAWNNVKENTAASWNAIQNSVAEHGGGIKGVIGAAVDAYKNIWKAGFDFLDKVTGGKFSEILKTITDKLTAIKDGFANIFDGIKEKVQNVLDALKNAFSKLQLKLPDIKLPHFSISGKFSMNPLSVPHISVDWYKQAYQNAVAFTEPTVLATSSGLKGFGDGNGAEIVIGQNLLLDTITAAVRNASPSAAASGAVVYMNIYPSPEMDDQAFAQKIVDVMDATLIDHEAVYA